MSSFEQHLKRTFSFFVDRKGWIQWTKHGERHRIRSLWKRTECQTESKALGKPVWRPFLLEAIPVKLGQKNLVMY